MAQSGVVQSAHKSCGAVELAIHPKIRASVPAFAGASSGAVAALFAFASVPAPAPAPVAPTVVSSQSGTA